jgi:hypothetical protein
LADVSLSTTVEWSAAQQLPPEKGGERLIAHAFFSAQIFAVGEYVGSSQHQERASLLAIKTICDLSTQPDQRRGE